MTRAVYQVRLMVKPEEQAAFNSWYEQEYVPKLMRDTPHFTSVRRLEGEINGEKVFITEYECLSETMDLAIAEMRAPSRSDDNSAFYRWRDRAIMLHESLRLEERLRLES